MDKEKEKIRKETLINRLVNLPVMTSEGYNGRVLWVELKKVISIIKEEEN